MFGEEQHKPQSSSVHERVYDSPSTDESSSTSCRGERTITVCAMLNITVCVQKITVYHSLLNIAMGTVY